MRATGALCIHKRAVEARHRRSFNDWRPRSTRTFGDLEFDADVIQQVLMRLQEQNAVSHDL